MSKRTRITKTHRERSLEFLISPLVSPFYQLISSTLDRVCGQRMGLKEQGSKSEEFVEFKSNKSHYDNEERTPQISWLHLEEGMGPDAVI